jgi:hypothetical protein
VILIKRIIEKVNKIAQNANGKLPVMQRHLSAVDIEFNHGRKGFSMIQNNNTDKNHKIQIVLKLFDGNLQEALKIYEQQLNILRSQAQVLMSLAGVVLTITGFSGHRIAGSGRFTQVCVIPGLGVVLLSAIWIWKKVLSIRRMTSDLEGKPQAVLLWVLHRWNAKTRAYTIGGFILCLGFTIYNFAFAKMLISIQNTF